ncbi:MAG: DUF1573 domain-containing protein [Planctomycetota bacterium]
MRLPIYLIPMAVMVLHGFVLPVACPLSRLQAQEPPTLVTEPSQYEFGEILSGEKLYREIKLINEGGEELVVKRIDFTCGCTIPKIVLSSGEEVIPKMDNASSFVVLAPGEWALIKLEFQSLGRFGEVKHRMDIYTNDPKGQVVHIPIVAQIRSAFLLTPPTVDFGMLDQNKTAFFMVQVKSNEVGDFAISGIADLPPFLSYEVEEAAKEEGAANPKDKDDKSPVVMLKLKYLGSAPLGKQAYNLKVHVDHPVTKDFKIFVEMRVVPSIAFTYEDQRYFDMVDLGRLDRDETKTAEILITNQDLACAFNVSQVVCKSVCDPPAEAVLSTEEPGMAYKVTLTIPPQKKGRIAHGRLILISDNPGLPQLSIRFKGFYMDGHGKQK